MSEGGFELDERSVGTRCRDSPTRRTPRASVAACVANTVEMDFVRRKLYAYLGLMAWPLVPLEWWRDGCAICRAYVPHGVPHDAKEIQLVHERVGTLIRLLSRVRSARHVRLNSAFARFRVNGARVALMEQVCALGFHHDMPSQLVNLVIGAKEGFPVECRLWIPERFAVWKQLRGDPPSRRETLSLNGLVATRSPTGECLYTLLTTDVWLQRRPFIIRIDDVDINEKKEPDPEIRYDLELDLYIYLKGNGDVLGIGEESILNTPIEVVTFARTAYVCRFSQILDNCYCLRGDARGICIKVEADGSYVLLTIMAADGSVVKEESQLISAREWSAAEPRWCFLLGINTPSYQSWQLVVEP